MKWIDVVKKGPSSNGDILSFDEYMDTVFVPHPERECRTTSLYLRDMFDHFGRDERGRFKLFSQYHAEATPVYGQVKTQNEIYQSFVNFVEEGFNNKFLLLVGPNGTAKTSIVKKIMKSAEQYSETQEGAMYTFSWVFPIDNYIKGQLGFASTGEGRQVKSYAHLDDKDITAILTSELKDHPLLLIPREARQKLIDDSLKHKPDQLDSIRRSYLYK